jgi:Tfp pilus assembly protein PilF
VSKAHARLADVYIRRDDLAAARVELEAATSLWPQHYAAFYKLSRVLNRLGESEAAQRAFRQYEHWERLVEERRGVPEPTE